MEIRTPVLALKGLRPSPLDDGGSEKNFNKGLSAGQAIGARILKLILQRQDVLRTVIGGAVDGSADRVGVHAIRGVGREHVEQRTLVVFQQPCPTGVLIEDDRHAVVHLANQFIWGSGDDGAGMQGLLFGCGAPAFPETGEEEGLVILQVKKEGYLGRFGGGAALPLEETICQDEAAPLAESIAVGRFFVYGLAARVDHAVADLLIFCPERDQTPAHVLYSALLRIFDHRDHLAGGDVVAALPIYVCPR